MKLDTGEKEILDSVERGEWRSARPAKRVLSRYSRAAKATFKKDRRLNIRISTKDLEAIQKRASSWEETDEERIWAIVALAEE